MMKDQDQLRFSTRAVRAGRDDLADIGVHALPIDLSSTYPFRDPELASSSLDALVGGDADAQNPIYARLLNPTVARFEQAFASLEGAEASVAFASGMAAFSAALLAASQDGRHIVACRPIYGTSDHLLESGLLGMEVTWTTPDEVASALREETSLVIIETPANPTLALVDIADVVRQAGNVPVMVDSTFATPVLQRPVELGAAMSLHSATKFLGGHGDVVGGVIAADEHWARRLRQVRILTGALLHPLAGYLLHRGLPTLEIRVKQSQSTASELARRLQEHPQVEKVLYPGLEGGDPRGLIGTQMSGAGGLFSFVVTGGGAAADAVMSNVRLMTPAVSLGNVDTLIQQPTGLTHRVVSEEGLQAGGISPGLLRVSVGLEDPEDLWADLEQALAAAK